MTIAALTVSPVAAIAHANAAPSGVKGPANADAPKEAAAVETTSPSDVSGT